MRSTTGIRSMMATESKTLRVAGESSVPILQKGKWEGRG